MQQTFVSEL